MILTYLETHDWLTNAAAREIVHVGTTAARSLLNGLVDRGYLRAEAKIGEENTIWQQKDRDEDIRR